MSTAAATESQELQDLKAKLKALEAKDKRIADFTPEYKAEAQQRNDAAKSEVRAAIKAATK